MAQRIVTVCDKCEKDDASVETVVITDGKAQEVDLCADDRSSISLAEAMELARPHIKRRQPRKTAASAPSTTGGTGRRGGRRATVSTLGEVAAKKTTASRGGTK